MFPYRKPIGTCLSLALMRNSIPTYMKHRALHSALPKSKSLTDSGEEGNQKGPIIESREHANEMYNYADHGFKIILTNWKLKLMRGGGLLHMYMHAYC